MANVASTPADVVNLALKKVGYRLRVGNLLDGSEASQHALDIYGQTRDQLQRQGNWGFVQRTAALTLLKSAPQGGYIPPTTWNPTNYPQLPWAYEYAYPEDMLELRALKQTPLFLFNPNPQPVLFAIANDNYVAGSTSQLATLALNAAGTNNYAPNDTINLTGGTQTTPAQLIVATTQVVSATVAAGGTGGTPGTQTVTGTTGTGTKFQASVTVSGGGAITAVLSITVAGSYTVNPTSPTVEPVTGASLTGAQLNVKLGVATFTIFNPGVFTVESLTFTQNTSSGTGTGATFQTATYTDILETQRVILANISDAVAVYCARITDPNDWPVDFTETFAAALAKRLTPVLAKIDAVQITAADEAMTKQLAESEQG